MARKLSHIPGVEIDEGRFKYVLIQVHTLDHQFRTFLRGNAEAAFHADVAQPLLDELSAAGLQGDVLGGGFIEHNSVAQKIYIWGASQKYGPAHHAVSVALCRAHYARTPGYKITSGEPPMVDGVHAVPPGLDASLATSSLPGPGAGASAASPAHRSAHAHARGTQAATASASPSPSASAPGGTALASRVQLPIRLAMLGAGIFAHDGHLPVLVALAHLYEIRAVYSRTRRNARALARRVELAVARRRGDSVSPTGTRTRPGSAGSSHSAASSDAASHVRVRAYYEVNDGGSSSDGDDGDDTEPESGNDGSHDEEGKVAGAAPRKRRLAALLRRSDIDAVSIALPIVLQPAFVRRALAAGKHVLSEKPIAHTVSAARSLLDDYRTHFEPQGLIWRVAENYRFEPAFDRAAEVLASGSLGTLTGGRLVAATPMGPDNKYVATPWRGSTVTASVVKRQMEQMQQLQQNWPRQQQHTPQARTPSQLRQAVQQAQDSHKTPSDSQAQETQDAAMVAQDVVHAGGFVLDTGVHYIAALRHMLRSEPTLLSSFGCPRDSADVEAESAMFGQLNANDAASRDALRKSLAHIPGPHTMSGTILFANHALISLFITFGGVGSRFELALHGTNAQLQLRRIRRDGQPGFLLRVGDSSHVSDVVPGRQPPGEEFFPCTGVQREFEQFARLIVGSGGNDDHPTSAMRDLAVVQAFLESCAAQGAPQDARTAAMGASEEMMAMRARLSQQQMRAQDVDLPYVRDKSVLVLCPSTRPGSAGHSSNGTGIGTDSAAHGGSERVARERRERRGSLATVSVMRKALEMTGMHAVVTSRLSEFLQAFKEQPKRFDVLLVCSMQDGDSSASRAELSEERRNVGLQAVHAVRKMELDNFKPTQNDGDGIAIAVLSSGREADEVRGLVEGADAVVEMPRYSEWRSLTSILARTMRKKYSPVDLELALRNLGTREFFDRMMRKFMSTDLPSAIQTIKSSHAQRDFLTLAKEAHSLKSTAGFVGAMQLSRAADQVQLLCKELCKVEHASINEAQVDELNLLISLVSSEHKRVLQHMLVHLQLKSAPASWQIQSNRRVARFAHAE